MTDDPPCRCGDPGALHDPDTAAEFACLGDLPTDHPDFCSACGWCALGVPCLAAR